jgi:hypothetical protein
MQKNAEKFNECRKIPLKCRKIPLMQKNSVKMQKNSINAEKFIYFKKIPS